MNFDNLQIAPEISEKQIDQLIYFSNNDPEILQNTTDSKRFKDREAFDVWFSNPKKIFVLTNEKEELLGIIWFPKAELNVKGYKGYGIGFAIRLYQPVRGQGLSKSFTQQTIELLKQTDFYKSAQKKGIWLDSLLHNYKAHSLYEKLGFKKVAELNERAVMILPKSE